MSPRKPAGRASGGAAGGDQPLTRVSARDEITLRSMRFQTLVGILPHESHLPQPLEVDLTVWIDARVRIVDYRALYDTVRDIVGQGPLDYLERAGERIADRVLREHPVRRVRVALRKPHVALPGPLAFAEVVIDREPPARDR
jgi:dihydroneopterin aldolase